MQILSVLVLSALAFVVEASPQRVPPTLEPPTLTFTPLPPTTTRPTLTLDPTGTIGPVRPTECVCPGRLLCCRSLVSSEDPAAQGPLNQLGVVVDGTDIPIGLGCTPYDPRLVRTVLHSTWRLFLMSLYSTECLPITARMLLRLQEA